MRDTHAENDIQSIRNCISYTEEALMVMLSEVTDAGQLLPAIREGFASLCGHVNAIGELNVAFKLKWLRVASKHVVCCGCFAVTKEDRDTYGLVDDCMRDFNETIFFMVKKCTESFPVDKM